MTIRGRTLLVVGGGLETVPGIRLARGLGLYVVVSDGSQDAPGLKVADDGIIASTYDIDETSRRALAYHETRRPIDGVICIGSDVPLTVAKVAETIGLRGISVAAAQLASDKLAMKMKFKADGVSVPWFSAVEGPDQLKEFIRARNMQLVVKPVDSRGARGVIRISEDVDIEWAYQEARRNSPTARVMAEEFLDGPQLSTESLVLDGIAYTCGVSDRNYEFLDRFAPFIIENGGDLPSSLPPTILKAVDKLINEAVASMGIREGVVKGDIVVHNGRPYVIELAARLSGGYLCTHQIPLSTGIDLVGNAIKLALGDMPNPSDLTPTRQTCVCQRFMFPSPGRVISISGEETVKNWPGIEMCEIRVKAGDIVRPADNHPARSGVVIAIGQSRRDARDLAIKAVQTVKILTEPL